MNSGKIEVLDLWSTGENLPPVDSTTNDYTIVTSSIVGDGYTVTFKRKLDTKDNKDTPLAINSDYHWGWAYTTG